MKKSKKLTKEPLFEVTYTEDVCIPLNDKSVKSLKKALKELNDIFNSDSKEEYELRKKIKKLN